jgi:phytoene dehydrogenase-like protein
VEFERFQRDLRAKQMHPESMAQDYPALTRQIGQTWQEATAAHVSDPWLTALLTILWTYTATPPSRLSAGLGMNLAGRYGTSGGWYPKGGAATIPNALADLLTRSGGRIEYGQTVTAIHTEDGRAVAVATESGRTVRCRSVISNAAAPLLPGLLGAGVLPEDFVERVTGPDPAISDVGVYLGLDTDVLGAAGLPHEVFLLGDYDTDAALAASSDGDWRRGGLVVTNYTAVDPGCAPEGGAVVAVMGAASIEYADTWGTAPGAAESPGAVKERVGDALIAAADEAIPGLAAAIVLREVATPITNQRYTLNPGGSWAGYDHTVTDIMSQLGPTTPVPNLFQAGAWTGGFGETTALQSGMRAAHLAGGYLDGLSG